MATRRSSGKSAKGADSDPLDHSQIPIWNAKIGSMRTGTRAQRYALFAALYQKRTVTLLTF